MAENEWFEKAWECMDNEDYAQAKEYFERAAKEGVAEAYCDLGNLYFAGNGVAQDYKQAFEMYLKGAKAGDPDCMDNLGMCYFWGHGTETDLQKAAFYNEKAAKAGIVRAMFDMGLNYERGYGVSQNIEKALFWLEKAAEENYPTALVELGDLYFVGELVEKDLEKSFSYYQRGAETGDIFSKLMLSTFYSKGLVVEKDLDKAKALDQEAYDTYYELAVTEDDRDAQFRLGNFYYYGLPLIGLDIDYSQAAEWYEKAAKNGLDHAQNNLANMYAYGVGVAQNYEKAFYWYSQAAERMNQEAMSNMANCYYLGRGVEQDYGKAAEFHTKAAHLGYANSQEVLGEMYMEGKGVEQNFTQAAHWLKESCENGERSAYGPFGDCYRKGLGVDKDEKMAFELYQKGAEMGDLRSKVSMAESLIEGWGVKCDYKRANDILEAVCNDEEEYRENLVTMVSHEDESGRVFIENPLDEENLPHYAKAYYLLGILAYAGKGTEKSNPSTALALLRMADRLGYEDKEHPEQTARELINKIEGESQETTGVNDSYIEIRDLGKRGKMGRFDIYVHHADGTESNVRFGTDRRKFCYLLLLLLISNKDSVQGLMARFFCYGRERLVSLARISLLADEEGPEKWIEKFIYNEVVEKDDDGKKHWTYEYANWMYSNELRKASDYFKEVCSDEELELYKTRSTGGRDSITSIAVSPEQIVIPDSLALYTKGLPTRDFMLKYKSVSRRSQDYSMAKKLNPNKYEEWDEETGPIDLLSE